MKDITYNNADWKRWLHIFTALFLAVAILVSSTTIWLRSTRKSSEKTVNDMAGVVMRESYINEIVNAGARRMSGYSICYCLVVAALLSCILLMVVRLYRRDRQNQPEPYITWK